MSGSFGLRSGCNGGGGARQCPRHIRGDPSRDDAQWTQGDHGRSTSIEELRSTCEEIERHRTDMRNDIVVTTVGQEYGAAYAAHYEERDLHAALALYQSLVAAHPDSPEAGYSRSQIQNIVKAVVTLETLSEAHVDLATAHLVDGDLPDVTPVRVARPAHRGAPEPSKFSSGGHARQHLGLVLLLCLSVMPVVAEAQVDEIPMNAHAKRYGAGWECDWGYRAGARSCEPIRVPAHAHLDGFGARWDCDRGYRDLNDVCVPVEVPPHAFLNASGHGWKCERGYQRDDESCVAVMVPADAYLDSSGDRWKCERGFRRSGASCVALVVPRHAHLGYSGNAWTCNPGYQRRGDMCLPDEQLRRVIR